VDTTKFFRAGNKLATNREIGFSEGPGLGTVGRLDPVKNQALLIEAVASLVKLFPRLKLVIAGSGPCQKQLEQLVSKFNLSQHVCLVGERDDIPGLLRSLDIFLLPSVSEGISNTILEAMACELPVVACDVGGNRELIMDGETGQLVPARDVDAFRRAIQEYLTTLGLIEAHGRAGRRRVERLFSLEKMVAAYNSMYAGLAG
jgi:glycosyltransferase involved in cell wall biosynthesis